MLSDNHLTTRIRSFKDRKEQQYPELQLPFNRLYSKIVSEHSASTDDDHYVDPRKWRPFGFGNQRHIHA